MTGVDLPDPPVGSGAVVEALGDGIHIVLPARGFRRYRFELIVLPVCFVLALGFLGIRLQGGLPPFNGLVEMGAAFTFIIPFFLHSTLAGAVWRVEVRASTGELVIRFTSLYRTRRWAWDTAQLRNIRFWQTYLQVQTAEKEVKLIRGRDAWDWEDFLWMTSALRRYLRLPEPPPREGELAVTFRRDLGFAGRWVPVNCLLRGYLRAERSRMVLRDRIGEEVPWTFRAAREGQVPTLAGSTWTLGPTDVTCRVEDDGSTVLLIAPEGKNLSVLVWCDDREALPRALARFWGANE